MMHLLWFIPFVAGLAAIWWEKLAGMALLVALVCGLAGLAYLAMRTRGPIPPLRSGQERDTRDVQRDIPPPPN
jgi:hypothetical protein